MGMKVNFINLDINSSGNLAMHIRQNSFEDLNGKNISRSISFNQPKLLEINSSIHKIKI